MVWLNSCLVNANGQQPKAVEIVWKNFHRILKEKIGHASCRAGFSFFSLKVMQKLVAVNYRAQPQTCPELDKEIDMRDQDIISYIGGYLLRRTRSHPGSDKLIDEHASPTGMIKLFDRGGLLVPKDNFIRILYEFELAFRELPLVSVDRDQFFKILDDKGNYLNFQQIFSNTDILHEVQESLYMDLAHLYFKVRAHQKCRQIFERTIKNMSTSRKSKALRDVLSKS